MLLASTALNSCEIYLDSSVTPLQADMLGVVGIVVIICVLLDENGENVESVIELVESIDAEPTPVLDGRGVPGGKTCTCPSENSSFRQKKKRKITDESCPSYMLVLKQSLLQNWENKQGGASRPSFIQNKS